MLHRADESQPAHNSCPRQLHSINSRSGLYHVAVVLSFQHSTINLAEMCVINTYNSNIATIDVGIAYRICSTQNYCPNILCIAGETRRSLRSRFSEHLRSIRNNTPGLPVTKHFNSTGHSISDNLVPDMQLFSVFIVTPLKKKNRNYSMNEVKKWTWYRG